MQQSFCWSSLTTQECRSYFRIELPSCLSKKKTRQVKFLSRYNCVENLFYGYCSKLWFFCAAMCSELIFLLSSFICWWWIKLIIGAVNGNGKKFLQHVVLNYLRANYAERNGYCVFLLPVCVSVCLCVCLFVCLSVSPRPK